MALALALPRVPINVTNAIRVTKRRPQIDSTSEWSRQFRAMVFLGCFSLFGGLGLTGCVSSMLANMAVKAPNQQNIPRAVKDPEYAARF
ncbi:MAG: hypothetical protein ABIP18_17000, partial [Steroidobacteraceae bacterium]